MAEMTKEKTEKIIFFHKLWLNGDIDGKRIDFFEDNLTGIDLSNTDLRKAIFRFSNLSNADLHECDLRDAIFFGTDLSGADLSNTDLRGAVLDKASLYKTRLRSANLQNASICGANFETADMTDADFFGAVFNYKDWILTNDEFFKKDLKGFESKYKKLLNVVAEIIQYDYSDLQKGIMHIDYCHVAGLLIELNKLYLDITKS